MADKTYTETVIADNPFPQEVSVPFAVVSQPSAGESYSEAKISNQEFPTKRIAQELIGNVLNTQSRKILQEFQFTKSGALQIGEYVSGSSGDIKISPDGIVGRNKSGVNTFVLDGDTGDATFLGTILAGSIISSGVIQGGTIDIGGSDATSFHVDADGNMWLGAATYAAAPFKVSNAGAVTGSDLTITGGSITGVTIAIGSADSIFKADSNGIYLGNATFASAPFRVTMAGAVTASNMTITGGSISGVAVDIGGSDTTSFHVDTTGQMWLGNATFTGAPFRSSAAGIVDIVELHLGNNGSTNYFASDSSLNMTANVVLSTGATLTWNGGDISGSMPTFTMGDNINLNGRNLININTLEFDERTSAPSDDDALFYYHNGATYRFQTRMESGNWSIDQTGV